MENYIAPEPGPASTLARKIINELVVPFELEALANKLKEPAFHKNLRFGLSPANKAIQRKLQQRAFGCEWGANELPAGYYRTR